MSYLKLILSLVFFTFLTTGCVKQLTQVSTALQSSNCESGLYSSCAISGISLAYAEAANKTLKEDTYKPSVAKIAKGMFYLAKACMGDYENAMQIHKNAKKSNLIACSNNTKEELANHINTSYCYIKNNIKTPIGTIRNYLPRYEGCLYYYSANTELVDELYERSKDLNALKHLNNLKKIYGLEDDYFIRTAVLELPNIVRNESFALKMLETSCLNALQFKPLGDTSYNKICKLYSEAKQANQYLCKKYKNSASCSALRNVK